MRKWKFFLNLIGYLKPKKSSPTSMFVLIIECFAFISARYRLNSENQYENEIHNEHWDINFYMNTGISSWHIWSIDPTKMRFLLFFQFDTRLLTSKHPKLFSTLFVELNGVLWKSCFSGPQNAKNEYQLKYKNQVSNWRFLECWVLEYERLNLSLAGEHIKVKRIPKLQ